MCPRFEEKYHDVLEKYAKYLINDNQYIKAI